MSCSVALLFCGVWSSSAHQPSRQLKQSFLRAVWDCIRAGVRKAALEELGHIFSAASQCFCDSRAARMMADHGSGKPRTRHVRCIAVGTLCAFTRTRVMCGSFAQVAGLRNPARTASPSSRRARSSCGCASASLSWVSNCSRAIGWRIVSRSC